jgi:hypothetical protein
MIQIAEWGWILMIDPTAKCSLWMDSSGFILKWRFEWYAPSSSGRVQKSAQHRPETEFIYY